ncbi:MAG TPA: M48 family metalloprotease, partial [Phnomibacter sp.]|nr:M48 family metalloprotease [Phnomibacter sp.]
AAISHRPTLTYTFRVLDSEVLNAFAVPGGYVYFTRGIMAHFNNEAEFAGVLGHEIGHITARHSAQQQTRQILGQGGLIAGVILAPEIVGSMAESAMQGLQLLFLSYSRDAERESDKLGVSYSTEIGYDAKQMAGFFRTLQRQDSLASGGGRLPSFMSTHPDPGERNQTVYKLAVDLQQQKGAQNLAVNRDNYLAMVEGIKFGPDPRQGFVEGNAFYHPELRFQFPIPQGWRTQNEPSRVVLASPDGKAISMLTLAQAASPREAAQTFVTNNKINVTDSRDVTVNGLPAFAIQGTIVQQQQQQQQQAAPSLSTLSYFIQHENRIYIIAGLSETVNFNQYAQILNTVPQGFRNLTDQAKLNKQPERIHIRSVSQGGSLQQALTRLGMPATRMQELAILNGMYLTDAVQAGQKIKIIGN